MADKNSSDENYYRDIVSGIQIRVMKFTTKPALKIVLSILSLILIFLQLRLWIGEGSVATIHHLETEIDIQSTKNSTLVNRNEALLKDVNDLKNGLDSLEERARGELGLIKEGETFYLIVDEQPGQ
ncbi:MAG: septum formation initiator family protein [Pseudohongiellaceae bacterium]|jgi:cell division protein FtsB